MNGDDHAGMLSLRGYLRGLLWVGLVKAAENWV